MRVAAGRGDLCGMNGHAGLYSRGCHSAGDRMGWGPPGVCTAALSDLQMKKFGRAEGVPLYSLMVAVYLAMLHRRSGQVRPFPSAFRMDGTPCCLAYHAVWDTVPFGYCAVWESSYLGYRAVWDIMLSEIPCRVQYHSFPGHAEEPSGAFAQEEILVGAPVVYRKRSLDGR